MMKNCNVKQILLSFMASIWIWFVEIQLKIMHYHTIF
jgi:hypothetical protein